MLCDSGEYFTILIGMRPFDCFKNPLVWNALCNFAKCWAKYDIKRDSISFQSAACLVFVSFGYCFCVFQWPFAFLLFLVYKYLFTLTYAGSIQEKMRGIVLTILKLMFSKLFKFRECKVNYVHSLSHTFNRVSLKFV